MPPVAKKRGTRRLTYLKQWRNHRGLSQEDVAERMELDRTTVSRVERGLSPYDQDFLERAALALGCDPEDLLTIDPTKPNPLRAIWLDLEKAPSDLQHRALGYLEGLLKAS